MRYLRTYEDIEDYVSEKRGYRQDKIHVFNLAILKKLYSSSSLADTTKKWKKISEEARIKMDAKKYNL